MRNQLISWLWSGLVGVSVLCPLTSVGANSGASRSARLGISYNRLVNDIGIESSMAAPGFVYVYEFNVSSRFTLGINLEYRQFSGTQALGQLGYGLLMKHYFEGQKDWQPYVEYGLLMSVSRHRGREGGGTAHDTRLAFGTDFRVKEAELFWDISYHYSRLSFFELPSTNLDYLQVVLGWRTDL